MPGLRCRQIAEADTDAVAALLARGFPARNRAFWLRAFEQLGRRTPPAGLPKYGYLMESAGTPVGAILLICASVPTGDTTTTRCNLSSWYVEPAFRAYAPLLVAQALRHKDVTYLNVSPAPNTWSTIEAQGFSRYCDGVFVAVPMLSRLGSSETVRVFDAKQRPQTNFDPVDQETLLQHAAHGCISLWCATADHAYPFVFRPRLFRSVIPYAQMIFCREVGDFVRFAGPIGRYLALRGQLCVIVDSNGPIPGLVGTFRRGSMPKYFRGPQRPRLGDLAYTEYALLGV